MSIRSAPNRYFLGIVLTPAAALAVWINQAWEAPLLIGWLVACNIVALPLWAFDKWSARRGGLRVPEMTLHGVAFLGACPASLLAMSVLRHKTAKPLFRILYVVFLVLQLGALGYWWFVIRRESAPLLP